MTRGERDAHGAQASATRLRAREHQAAAPGRAAAPDAAPFAEAAARYLDAWDRNQAEVARLGPPVPGASSAA